MGCENFYLAGTITCADCKDLRAVKECKENICPNPSNEVCSKCICVAGRFVSPVVKKNGNHQCKKKTV